MQSQFSLEKKHTRFLTPWGPPDTGQSAIIKWGEVFWGWGWGGSTNDVGKVMGGETKSSGSVEHPTQNCFPGFGIILDSCWTHFGFTLDSSWDHFGIICLSCFIVFLK